MNKTWRAAAGGGLVLSLLLAGCQLAALAAGHGSQEALYKFGKDQRVLVVVDAQEAVSLPPGFEQALAEKINTHLYSYKATDHLVPQERLMDLKDKTGEGYKKLGLADIAAGTDADVVLSVLVMTFSTPVTTDGTVGQGMAEVYVKVVDRQGKRLWPAEQLGTRVNAHEDPVLTMDRTIPATVKSLSDQLAMRTGRMFHKYSLDDRTLTK